ncbi:O-antigen ligase family protein [Dechloromonas sp. ZS-1]|uniref:O-antigen ligase family protein n=1 Tax=Dechloromonas sp. ZS-1 TaxID=3138067 RepID=UPI0031FD8B35
MIEANVLLYVVLVLGMVIYAFFSSGLKANFYFLLVYMSVLVVFENQNGWGMLISDLSQVDNIYNKGTGYLYISLVNVFLFYIAASSFVDRFYGVNVGFHNLNVHANSFFVLFLCNIFYGIFVEGLAFFDVVSYKGVLNIFNFSIFFFALVSSIKTEKNYYLFFRVFLAFAFCRGLWGLIRYAFLGGDPSNFYANNQGLDVKLTFFDINDSFVATVAAFLVLWRLVCDGELKFTQRLLFLAIFAVEILVVVLSYRRTAWIGLGLAYLLFAACQPKALRFKMIFSLIAIGLPVIMVVLAKRSNVDFGEISLQSVFPDIFQDGELSFDTGRFAELYAAYIAIEDSLLFGLGTWGSYDGSSFAELEFHENDFTWMHSGVLHIALKMGLVGVFLSFAVIYSFSKFVRAKYLILSRSDKGVAMAGVAGVLFMLPNWFFGTPVIEYRTMQLFAFAFALPYIAFAFYCLKKSG